MDECLAYSTPKVVVIKDRLLGGLRLAGIIGIAIYFLCVRILADQSYLVYDEVDATIETSFEAPAGGLVPQERLPYCSRELAANALQFPLPCVTGPDAWVALPSTGSNELFVATRLKDVRDASNTTYSYVQDPESYTIGVTFSMQAMRLRDETHDSGKFSKNIAQIRTRLLEEGGQEMDGAIQRIGRWDVIPLRTLLRAGNIINIDAASGPQNRTIRQTGCLVYADIFCHSNRDGEIDSCDYTVSYVVGSAAEASLVSGVDVQARHSVQYRRGIKVIFRLSGRMGQIRLSAFMLAWVSATAMFGMVSVVIDALLRWVMPLRDIYTLLKWEESVDFSDYRQRLPSAVQAVENLREEARRRNGPSIADKADEEAPQCNEQQDHSAGGVDEPIAVIPDPMPCKDIAVQGNKLKTLPRFAADGHPVRRMKGMAPSEVDWSMGYVCECRRREDLERTVSHITATRCGSFWSFLVCRI